MFAMLSLQQCSFCLLVSVAVANGFVPRSSYWQRSLLKAASRCKAVATETVFETLSSATVVNPSSDQPVNALEGLSCAKRRQGRDFLRAIIPKGKTNRSSLVVLSPQLGDFDTFEYAELLAACVDDLVRAGIDLRFIGIGDSASARRFSRFTGIPLEYVRVDPSAALHRALGLHRGPDWDVPSWIPAGLLRWFRDYVGASSDSDERLVARAWLNYMAMCAGIAAPDTLAEILRGYLGDRSAPERLRVDDVVTVGEDAIVIRGTTNVKLGPVKYQSLWKNERGYQRPAELATVRLRGMVEVLTHLQEYVPDQTHLAVRGATYLLSEDGNVLYQHLDTGVLGYSATMARPLTFLQDYIGPNALNPLGLGDTSLDKPKAP